MLSAHAYRWRLGCAKMSDAMQGTNPTSFLKAKLRDEGIRIVYRLVREKDRMFVVVIGMREDDEVYEIAQRRIDRHGL